MSRRLTTLGVMLLWAGVAHAGEAAGLAWTEPKGWTAQGPKPMRVSTHQVPAAKGDPEGGELAVFYFGPNQGGGVDANVQRWLGQFRRPDGAPLQEKDWTRKTEKQAGLNVIRVDARGTYAGGGPMSGGPAAPKPGFRLLGAIVEGPQGAVFFKLTGPEKTVAAAEKDFRALLASLKKG